MNFNCVPMDIVAGIGRPSGELGLESWDQFDGITVTCVGIMS